MRPPAAPALLLLLCASALAQELRFVAEVSLRFDAVPRPSWTADDLVPFFLFAIA